MTWGSAWISLLESLVENDAPVLHDERLGICVVCDEMPIADTTPANVRIERWCGVGETTQNYLPCVDINNRLEEIEGPATMIQDHRQSE